MKKRTLFFSGISVLVLFCFFCTKQETEPEYKAEQTDTTEEVSLPSRDGYYIKAENGDVIVYLPDHTVYEYTDLDPALLPIEIMRELNQGKHVEDQEELYEFLETYSS